MLTPTIFLMYHAVLDTAATTQTVNHHRQDSAYAVSRDDFCAQLDLIAAQERFDFTLPAALTTNNFSTDFELTPPDPKHAVESSAPEPYDEYEVCLTFDDAWREHLYVAAPELKARGIPAIFCVTTGQVGKPGMLTWDEVVELARMGFTIGSHGVSHRFLTTLTKEEILRELWESRGEIEGKIGQPVKLFSFPGGRGDASIVEYALKKNYTACFGSQPGIWTGERLVPVPRYAIRAGQAGSGQVRRLLTDLTGETVRLVRRHERLSFLKRILGDRVYHLLHGVWARLRG